MTAVILRIGGEDQGNYPVQLFRESADPDWAKNAVAESAMPAALTDPHGDWDAKRARDAVRGSPERTQLAVGEYLYQLLFQGDVATQWADATQAGAETVLEIEPKGLQLLPWELLCGPDHRFVALKPNQPFYRHFVSKGKDGGDERLPLRVLVVVGERDADDKIGWLTELKALRRVFRDPARFDMEELIRPRRGAISEIYSGFRPHVFHFIGHGYMVGKDPALRIWKDVPGGDGEYEDWTPAQMLIDLAGWTVPMAFINACRSGDSLAAEGSFNIAAAFADLGARCTITMQGDIDGKVAAAFATRVYQEIAEGVPLHRAVAIARVAVNQDAGMTSDWPVPVLQMCCAPGVALPRTPAVAKKQAEPVIETFSDLGQFVDRTEQRRHLCRDTTGPQPSDRTVFVVHGASGLGKTFLLRWCARHFALRDRDVRYIDFDDGSAKDFVGVLKLIRFGDGKTSPVTGRLDDAAFAPFDERLAQVTKTQSPTEDVLGELSSAFRQGLNKAAEARSLFLCLDHFEWRGGTDATVVNGDFRFFVEHVLEPLESGGVKNVKVLLTINDRNLNAPDLKWFRSNAAVVPLNEWDLGTYEFLARAALDDLLEDDDVTAANLLMAWRARWIKGAQWSPSVLAGLRRWVEGLIDPR